MEGNPHVAVPPGLTRRITHPAITRSAPPEGAPRPGRMLELRQVFEASDFGEALPPELRAAEDRLREEGEARLKKRYSGLLDGLGSAATMASRTWIISCSPEYL